MTIFVQTLNQERKFIYLENFNENFPILDMILTECKKISDFRVINNGKLSKWLKNLRCCYKRRHKIMDQRVLTT